MDPVNHSEIPFRRDQRLMSFSTKFNICMLLMSLAIFLLPIISVLRKVLPLAAEASKMLAGALLVLVVITIYFAHMDKVRLDQKHLEFYKSGTLFVSMIVLALFSFAVPLYFPNREDLPLYSGVFRGFDDESRSFQIVVEVDDNRMTFGAHSKIRPELAKISDGAKVKILADDRTIVECITEKKRIGDYDEYAAEHSRPGYYYAVTLAIAACAHLYYTKGPFRWRL